MQTDIYYRDITKTENLEAYLMERVEGTVEEFLKYDSGAHVTVRVETDRHRSLNRKPSYLCEVIVKPSYSKKIIKVLKTDGNFQSCVSKAVSALRTLLVKQSGKKVQRRRRHQNLMKRQEELPAYAQDWSLLGKT